jgi:hypothetical protein
MFQEICLNNDLELFTHFVLSHCYDRRGNRDIEYRKLLINDHA